MNKEVTLPNFLTLLRLLLAPAIFYLIFIGKNQIALIVFILAILTDLLDGFIARKYHLVTELGSHLDRWADKILMASVIFALLLKNQYYAWIIVYTLGIFAFLVGNIYFVRKKIVVSRLSKTMVWLEAILLAAMIYGYVNNYTIILFSVLLGIPAIDYIRKMI